jgi:beta-lactam-binding protein with PASTA domain
LKSFDFLFTKAFWKHVFLSIVIFFGVAIALMQYLSVFTQHGEEIEVPDLSNLPVDELEQLIIENELRFSIVDSTYISGKQPGLVYEQDPKPGSKVKRNRTIYISITSSNTPKVKLPELIDLSLRKATIDLKNAGLNLGQLIMRPDIANNVVLEMQIGGNKVYPGRELPRGSSVDFVVGIYNVDSLVPIPNLLGLTIEEARFYLSESALYLGRVGYEKIISDTSKALVTRQFPESIDGELINTMSYIDIWVAETTE